MSHEIIPKISLATRLKCFSLIMAVSFAVIAAVIIYSLTDIENMTTRAMRDHLEQVVRNSRMSREVSDVFADIRLLMHLFYGKPDFLDIEGEKVLAELNEIRLKIIKTDAGDSFQALHRQLGGFLEASAEVNGMLARSKDAKQAVLSDLDQLENTITESVIRLTVEGMDTAGTEALFPLINEYRETILQIGKAYGRYKDNPLKTVSDVGKSTWIIDRLNALDSLALRFAGNENPVLAYGGKRLRENTAAWRDMLLEFSGRLQRHDMLISGLESSMDRHRKVMENEDRKNVDATELIRRKVEETIRRSRLTIFILPVVILFGIIYMTSGLIRRHIRIPMSEILKGINAFHGKSLDARIRLKRNDEWGDIEETFNLMADELDQSYSALRASENYLNGIIDSMPSPLFGIDPEGRITRWNSEAETVTGISKETAAGRGFTELLPQLISESKRVEAAVTNRKVQKHPKASIMFNGKKDFFNITAYPLGGENAGSAVIRMDNVTEQVQTEKMLAQSEKMFSIGRMATGIAHDFNNILTGIIGYTGLIRRYVTVDSPAAPCVKNLLAAAHRAKDLVSQIQTFSRQAKQEKVYLSLESVINEASGLIRATLPSSVKIRQNIEKTHLTVLADPTQMHQVVMNLCTNAADAMKTEGGILDITLSKKRVDEGKQEGETRFPEPGEYIYLAVSDTGQGIPPEIIGQIYDPFFTTKKMGEGTGMGLSVVRRIVDAHNGVIEVESRPGKGSRFRIYLPAFEKIPKTETGEDIMPLSKGSERILFVDDDPAVTGFAEQIFRNLGYSVAGFTDSGKALETFLKNPYRFDILVSDLIMPGMSGNEIVQEIHRVRPDIPIILCSGTDEDDIKMSSGLHYKFIKKPFSAGDLAETTREAFLSRKQPESS